MYKYQKTNQYFAQISGGIEELGADELAELGASNLKIAFRGIHFTADKSTLYNINYRARSITRVLACLMNFDCHNSKYLYRKARSINWSDFITTENTFAIFANVSNSKIKH